MNIALWIAQAILSIKLLTTAVSHGLGQTKSTMRESKQKWGKSAGWLHPLLAILLFLGGAGLILPGLFLHSFQLTIYSSGFLALMLILSILFHMKTREKTNLFVSIILFLIAVFIVIGRWKLNIY